MTGPVVVALDGSEKDARALAVAAAVGRLSGAELQLVQVIHAPTERLTAQAELLGIDEGAVSGRQEVEARLDGYATSLAIDTLPQITCRVIEGADAAAELVRHVADVDALLVVMATRAASAVGLALVGSVADRVLREGTKPVVLVPPRAAYMRGKRVELGRVLVPLDGSELSARSLDFLLGLPRASELEYVLLEVVPPSDGREQSGEPARELRAVASERVRAAEARLRAAAEHVRARGAATVDVCVVEDADPSKAIAASVRDLFVEMIAMSTRGAGGLRRLALGSVAQGVVRASEMPVLLLTPGSLAE